ncbi:MAG: LysE family translocator [Gammaproteobacteria bacterium]|nr:LysE family translocator [Gammaproteobacteria bacterium]
MLHNLEVLSPFLLVAYTMWATPGPNNMMLTNSGARFGFKATLPHILGIVFGTCILNLSALTILKPLIDQWPQLLLILKIVGTVWLLIIGWKMATSHNLNNGNKKQQPMSFVAATLFQFANPKAISATLALVSVALVSIKSDPQLIWIVALLIPPLSLLSIIPWVIAGQTIRRFLSTTLRWQIFTWTTGGLTASCAVLLWI